MNNSTPLFFKSIVLVCVGCWSVMLPMKTMAATDHIPKKEYGSKKIKAPLALYFAAPLVIGLSPKEKNIMAVSSIAGELTGGFVGALYGTRMSRNGLNAGIMVGAVGGSIVATSIAKRSLDTKISITGTVAGTLLGTYAALRFLEFSNKSPEFVDIAAILSVMYLGARTGMEIPLIKIHW